MNGSTVQFAGSALTTTFVNSTLLSAVIPASSLTASGTFLVTVVTAGPGGGTSNTASFGVKGKVVVTSPASAVPNLVKVGQDAVFSVAGSESDGKALFITWDMGDGTVLSGSTVTHRYSAPQTYTVVATLLVPGGDSASSSVQIDVTSGATAGGSLTIIKKQLKVKNPSVGTDTVTLVGTVAFQSSVTSLSGSLTLTVGGLGTTFTLSNKGFGKAGTSSFKFGKILPKKRRQICFQIFVEPTARSDDRNERRVTGLWLCQFFFKKIEIVESTAERFPAHNNEKKSEKIEGKNH